MPGSKNKKNKYYYLIVGAIFFALIFGISYTLTSAQTEKVKTRADNISIEKFPNPKISQDSNIISYQTDDKLSANKINNTNKEWVSEVFKTNFVFDSLGAQWRKDEQSNILISVRFSKDNKDWENWQDLGGEWDADEGKENSASANNESLEVSDLIFSNSETQYFQYKVIFQDKINEAYLESISFTYLNSSNNSKVKTLSNLFRAKKAQAVNSPRVISRAEWGADPAYMTWAPEYAQPNKIIIHHTASGNNPPDPAAVVRSIYYYHAVTLGWGDIGYNYLFDQYGTIYEGRAGGNGAIGAHAYGQNTGSIGFSVIGTFSSVNITQATFNALVDLTAYKTYENDFSVSISTVFGHRDFCNNPPGHNCTACPGEILYGRRAEIINAAWAESGTYLQRDRDFLINNNNVLVKSYTSPTVYLWINGTKRPIADAKTFAMLGYSWNQINYLSSMALNEKPLGDKITSLFKTADSPTVYLIGRSPDIRYRILDLNTFNQYSFSFDNVTTVSIDELNYYPDGGNLTLLIKSPDSQVIYRINSGYKEKIASPAAFDGWGFNWSEVINIKSAFINEYRDGRTLYYLVRPDGVNVYLLQNKTKHKVPNLNMFNAWGFNWNEITATNMDEDTTFTAGNELLRIARGSGPETYLIDVGKKILFPNMTMLNYWSLGSPAVFVVQNEILNRLPSNGEVTELVRATGSDKVYLMSGGKKYQFSDAASFNAWGKDWQAIKNYSTILVNEIQNGIAISKFIKKDDALDPNVYLVVNGQKSFIPNLLTLNLWGGNIDSVSKLPVSFFNSLTETGQASYLIKGSSASVYLVDNGKKDLIPNVDTLNAWGLSSTGVMTVNDTMLGDLPNNSPLNILIKTANDPKVYKVEAGKKAIFPSPTVFLAWGYNFNQVTVVNPNLLNLLGNENNLSIFARLSDADPNVYLLHFSEKKHIPNPSLLAAYQGNNTIAISSYINRLPTNGTLNRVNKSSAATVYYMDGGKKFAFTSVTDFYAWGFNFDQVTYLRQEIINLFPDGGTMSRLVKGTADPIFLMSNGKKRFILTADVFISFGFNFNQVRTLDDNSLNVIPNGLPVLPNTAYASITANNNYRVINTAGFVIKNSPGGLISSVNYYNGRYYFIDDSGSYWYGSQGIRFEPTTGSTIIEVLSYYDPNWNQTANYNRFRGSIELAHSATGNWIVNDLSLNDYTAGIAEAPGGNAEYLKTMAVAARSYGYWHLSRGGKHAGEPFHLKNSRRGNGNDQVYAGYGFEALAPQFASAARTTDNQVITFGGAPALTAYSHGSYPRTKSALEAWGIDYAWLQAVADPYGDPARPCGVGGNHCVGLSASGAIGFAQNEAKTYSWILGYYYVGTALSSINNQNIRIAIYSF